MKVRVNVTLKPGVLDPQGAAVRHSLGALGFDGVNKVRQGKVIELDLNPEEKENFDKSVEAVRELFNAAKKIDPKL